ncbi:MAG: MFS transporter [Cellulomonas sp.]|uniref:MFS transporter n=1 Tax=Cellulomonas sp. 73-92 TaxID=1895740 RepID=UPI000925D609|nr:MFS transporter [Cellulomonas sp. 73-92]MBN9375767.1 MFS transporter [Cellulomonas sp.]OJV81537.1 MAG: MFS transporter [Cellulomonas sp. 73-92]
MANSTSGEKTYADLSSGRRWLILIIASMGSSIIYAPAYLKAVFYDPLQKALGVTNTQLGQVFSAYAITALICYLPSGIIADKVRMRTLASVGFISTAVLTFVYAMLPSIGMLYAVFVLMGITTILIWWGVRYKLVRLVSKEDEYPKRIGVSYGVYGVAGLLIGLVSTAIVAAVGENLGLGVSIYLYFLAGLILVLGILSALFIPKFAGEIKTEGGFSLVEFVQAFRSPVVWIAAVSLFFVYFFYTGVTYTTPYMTGILGVSLAAATVVANIRNYGITLLSGPAFGWVANRFKPSIVIAVGSIVFIVALLAMMLLPTTAAVMVIACVLVVLLGFIANGAFSVVSAQLTEGKVPLAYFGAATGLLSIIGFLPDTFSSTWFGSIMDAQTDAAGNVQAGAYHQIFWILIASAVLAAIASLGLYLYLRRSRAAARDEVAVAATAAV